MNRGPHGREAGSALAYTLMSVAVLAAFLSILYDNVVGLMRSSREWQWKERVMAAAESGVALAQARLWSDPTWLSGEKGVDAVWFKLDGVDVELRTEQFRVPDVVWVFATARDRHARRETVQPLVIQDPTLFAVMARRRARLGAGAIVTGTVTAARVKLEDGSEVVGSVISAGGMERAADQAEAMIFDSATSPPEVPELRLKSAPGEDLTLKDWSDSKPLVIAGTLTLGGNVLLSSTDDTPVIIVGKDLTGTLQGSKIRGVIYVAGRVTLRGQGLITGTIIADEVDLAEGVVVQSFDAARGVPRPKSAFWKRRVARIRN